MEGASTSEGPEHVGDRRLVERMIAGDEGAFETFSDDYIPALYRFALYRLNRDHDLAEEIVQATLVKVIAKMRSFRGDAALMTWLCAVCRMEIAGHFRTTSRRPQEVEWSGEETSTAVPVNGRAPEAADALALRHESAEMVHRALDLLPPRYGKALEWKYLQDLSVKQIAERMEMTPKATESLLTRARNAFREVYTRQLNPPELRLTRS
jgi:RNA polymerase sigma factor (sigma-70 family)